MKEPVKLGTEDILGPQAPAKWESLPPPTIGQDPREIGPRQIIPFPGQG